jgi:hypothetical protein
MDATADVTMTGVTTSDSLGVSVAGVGDVNGDGFDDVIVGATTYTTNTGRAYIYFGGASMNNTADVTLTGETTNNNFGKWVAGLGDYNADGYTDVLVGADEWDAPSTSSTDNTGRAYIYYGGSTMDTTADITMTGESASSRYGHSAGLAGDVNGDGFNDLTVGALGHNASTGKGYVYYQSNAMNSTADVIMTGESISNYFGFSVSGAGDLNGDGYKDIIVAAYGHISSTVAGKTYIYWRCQ